ncbi:MAG: lysostaphin resistance A-like protein, partial [Planctomycetota bacterium]
EPLALADQAKLSMGAYGGQVVAVLLFAWARQRAAGLERPRLGIAVLIGAGGLLLVYPMLEVAAIGAEAVARYLGGETPPLLAHDTLASLVGGERDIWFVIMLALVIVAAPIVEEVMYRGILQETLRLVGFSRWLTILATSALFAAMHLTIVEPHALVPLFVLSVGLGWAYEKSGRLTAPVTMHLLFNVANLALAFLFMNGGE